MKNLINGIISLIFLGSISSVIAGTTESLAKTDALIHLEKCFSFAQKKTFSLIKIADEFIESIKDIGDDPGCFDKLSKIARNLGADHAQLGKMWDEYGLTDEGHNFFLTQISSASSKEKAKRALARAIKLALSK